MVTVDMVDQYTKTHLGSQELYQRAVKVFANGATHVGRIFEPFRPYISHAKGSRKWDVDGHEYIDYTMSHGALILGHSHPEIVRAVQEQMAKGTHYGSNHELEVEWAELIKSMMPSAERVRFFACGNEANMMALRLGRIFTGRKKILKFQNHFHGWNDHVVPPGTPGTLPEDNAIYTTTIPSNNLSKLEEELAKKEYAVLMTEGGGASMGGQYPLEDGFVHALPDITRKYGTIWVVDEVVTGFRFAPGGWQAIVGVKPDLTTLGKCIGGGLGCGALVGRADIMEAFDTKAPVERRVTHSGTWNANPLVAAAGIATLKFLRTGEPQKQTDAAAARLRKGCNQALKERDIKGRLYGRSICHGYLGPIDYEPPDDILPPSKDIRKLMNPEMTPTWNRMLLHLLQRGVDNMGGRLFILSAAHTEADIDETVRAFSGSLDAMMVEGTLRKS